MIQRVTVYTRWGINELITAQRRDLLLTKNVRRLDKGENKTKKGSVLQVTEDDDFAFTVQLRSRDIPTVGFELGGVQLDGVLVDSGFTCNVIDRDTWELLKKRKIKSNSWKSNKKLYSYGSKEPLNTAGEFETELCYKDRQCVARFVVVDEKARPMLSRQTSELLAILNCQRGELAKRICGDICWS